MSKPDVILATSLVTRQKPGSMFSETTANGDPDAIAIVEAMIDRYDTVNKTPFGDDFTERLKELATQRANITLLRSGSNFLGAPLIAATSGRLFLTASGVIGLLPGRARSKGVVVKPNEVLDFTDSKNGVEILRERVEAVRATLPKLQRLTQERIEKLPNRMEEEGCTLTVFGTYPMPDGPAYGAIWFLHSYMKEEDIAEGVLILPEGIGFSEHGSILAKQFRNVGEVINAPTLTLREALAFTDKPYDEALKFITGGISCPTSTSVI